MNAIDRYGVLGREELEQIGSRAKEKFFPFVFESEVFDVVEIAAGRQRRPVEIDARHRLIWTDSRRWRARGISIICSVDRRPPMPMGAFAREYLHLSMGLFFIEDGLPVFVRANEVPESVAAAIAHAVLPVCWRKKAETEFAQHYGTGLRRARRLAEVER